MKTVCAFISFIVVNVLANIDMKDYKQRVFLTNKLIQNVYDLNTAEGNGLENVIKTYVYHSTMGQLNLMFAVPDRLQYPDQILIAYLLQTNLLQTLQLKFFFPVPELDKFPENLNLAELGDKRREYIGQALENIIRSGFKYHSIYHADGRDKVFETKHICRFIALYRNTKLLAINNSLGYIKTAVGDKFGTCTLTSTHNNNTTYYKKFGNQIFQVWPDGAPIKPLLDSASTSSSSSAIVISIEDRTDN